MDADSDDRRPPGAAVVRKLIAVQFPHWADLLLEPVPDAGWDNATFRLGRDLKLRLPTAARYAGQPAKEDRWLPRLAPHLPAPIPEPVALGAPGPGFPFPWGVQRWLAGAPATLDRLADPVRFAQDLAGFVAALHRAPGAGGPAAGAQSFHRGGDLAIYDDETRACLAALAGAIDAPAARRLWQAALGTRWSGPSVWVHGDIAPGNLLVADGRLAGVIDFGSCAIGDPACDLAITWTFLPTDAGAAFRAALPLPAGTWSRARGWALWKALLILAGRAAQPKAERPAGAVLAALLAEPPLPC